jgi:sulfite exporter TauE/SafE
MSAAFMTGAILGLINLPHCAGMCGPLVSVSCGQERRTGPLRYQLGRTASYVCAGAVAGHVGEALAFVAPGRVGGWVFAALTAGACLLAARSLLGRGPRLIALRTSAATRSPLARLLQLVPRDPELLGLVSVLLPCGLLAAALVAAVATGSGAGGALLMLGFVMTSGLALLGTGWLFQLLPAQASPKLRRIFAGLLVLSAVVSIARPLRSEVASKDAAGHVTPHCH